MALERLQKSGKGYRFRVTVPTDLRTVFGKREVKVSLKTSDYDEARKQVRQLSAEFDRQVDAYRAILQSPTQLTDLSPDQIQEMVRTWRDKELADVKSAALPENSSEAMQEIEYDLASMEDYDLDAQTSVTDRAARLLAENGVRLELRQFPGKLVSLLQQPYKVPTAAIGSDQFTVLVKAIRTAIIDILEAERGDVLGRTGLSPIANATVAREQQVPEPTGYPSVSLADLKTHFDQSEKRAHRVANGVKDKHTVAWRVLREVLGEDRQVATLRRKDFETILSIVKSMPPKIDDKFPDMGLLEAVEAAKERGMSTIAPRTINGYMDAIDRLMKHAVKSEMRPPIDISDLRVEVPNWSQDQRRPFTTDELNRIFFSFLYVNSPDRPSDRKTYDPVPRHSYQFWLPVIALFSGMRCGEIAQLLVSDIEVIDGVQCFLIRLSENNASPEFYKKLKNSSAERIVPVHPELAAIGFPAFVQGRKSSGDTRLFADAKLGSDETFSQIPSQWFGRRLTKMINKTKQTTFHSLRHNFRDATREAHLSEDTVCSLMGWTKNGKSMSFHYGSGLKASSLAEEIAKVRYEGLDLSHLYQDASRSG